MAKKEMAVRGQGEEGRGESSNSARAKILMARAHDEIGATAGRHLNVWKKPASSKRLHATQKDLYGVSEGERYR